MFYCWLQYYQNYKNINVFDSSTPSVLFNPVLSVSANEIYFD